MLINLIILIFNNLKLNDANIIKKTIQIFLKRNYFILILIFILISK